MMAKSVESGNPRHRSYVLDLGGYPALCISWQRSEQAISPWDSENIPKLNTLVRFPSSAPRPTSVDTFRTVRLAGVGVTGCHNSIQSVTSR
jgi:hypothetical protein